MIKMNKSIYNESNKLAALVFNSIYCYRHEIENEFEPELYKSDGEIRDMLICMLPELNRCCISDNTSWVPKFNQRPVALFIMGEQVSGVAANKIAEHNISLPECVAYIGYFAQRADERVLELLDDAIRCDADVEAIKNKIDYIGKVITSQFTEDEQEEMIEKLQAE